MQDRYTGDLGDFGKYGLLRALCQRDDDLGPQLSLGVVWYLVPDEEGNDDGKHTRYLDPSTSDQSRFRRCDPALYDGLWAIIRRGSRRVSWIRQRNILPSGTVFYEIPLTFHGLSVAGQDAREARLAHRREWLQGAVDSTNRCDVVFVDPDNGLEVGTMRHHKRGPKYVYFDELRPYVQRGQSVVVYQHISRARSAAEQINARLSQLSTKLSCPCDPFALLYHRGTSRAFFVVPGKGHRDILARRADRLVRGPWGEHFTGPSH